MSKTIVKKHKTAKARAEADRVYAAGATANLAQLKADYLQRREARAELGRLSLGADEDAERRAA